MARGPRAGVCVRGSIRPWTRVQCPIVLAKNMNTLQKLTPVAAHSGTKVLSGLQYSFGAAFELLPEAL